MKVVNISGRVRHIAHPQFSGAAEPDVPVEVPAEVGTSLLRQADVWAKPAPTKKTTTMKEG